MAEGKHIVVTGGAGFIGSHLVERLLKDGETVVVIDDCSTGSLANLEAVNGNPRLQVLQAKISACEGLENILQAAKGVYHLAAAVGVELVLKSPIQTIQTNLHETEVILEQASRWRVPILLTSTSEVYGKSQREAFSEEDDLLIGPPQFSRWSYACSKLMDEFLAMAFARERGLPVVIARLFNTVGPRQTGRYGMVLPRFIEAARLSKPLQVYGDGEQTRCFCYVDDTVEALVRLLNCTAAQGQVFNVGNDEEVSIRKLAELVIEWLGSHSSIEHLAYEQALGEGFEDMRRRRPVLEKLERVTGFRPKTSLEAIVRLTERGLQTG
jgi:UDP-glucose 4-epimerase